jgi:tetratricopeptide (TPR) repeat protein
MIGPNGSSKKSPPTYRLILYGVLLVTALVYLPSLGSGFVGYDDPQQVYENHIVTGGLHFRAVRQSFTSFVMAHYQPLVTLSFALEYSLVGPSPTLYHVDNLLLHLVNVLLLYLLLLRILRSRAGAILIAAAFALHPMRVESVAWITERKDVLGGLFYLSSFLLYVLYRRGRSRWHLAASILLFLLSLLCKAMAVTLAPILLAYELIWRDGGVKAGRLISRLLPFVLLAAAFSVVVVVAHDWMGGFGPSSGSVPYRLIVMSRNILYYPVKTLLPINMCAFHPRPPSDLSSLPLHYKLSPVVLLAALSALAVWGRRNRLLTFGAVFYLVCVLPVSQLVFFGRTVVADRFSYLPSIGLLIMLWSIGASVVGRWNVTRTPLLFVSVVWIAAMGWLARSRTVVWSNEVDLWTEAIEEYPQAGYPYYLRGLAYTRVGETGLALHDFRKSASLQPEEPEVFEAAALLLMEQEEYDRAIEMLREGLESNEGYPELMTVMGLCYLGSGELDIAADWFDRALSINPAEAWALSGMAELHLQRGNPDSAEIMARRSLRCNPDLPVALNLLGNILLDRGRVDSAMVYLGRAARFEIGEPRHSYLVDLGRAYLAAGDNEGAIGAFSTALELDRHSYAAYHNLGMALMQAGRLPEAVECYDLAIELNPDLPEPYLNRGNAKLGMGLLDESLDDYSSAIEADSAYSLAWANRARLLHHLGRHTEALDDIRTALELGYPMDSALVSEIEEAARAQGPDTLEADSSSAE